MRVGVLLFLGLGLSVITGACGGPGATDAECTSGGNVCVNLSAKPTPYCAETLPYQCAASGAGYVCCAPGTKPGSGGSSGSGGTSGSGGSDAGKG